MRIYKKVTMMKFLSQLVNFLMKMAPVMIFNLRCKHLPCNIIIRKLSLLRANNDILKSLPKVTVERQIYFNFLVLN